MKDLRNRFREELTKNLKPLKFNTRNKRKEYDNVKILNTTKDLRRFLKDKRYNEQYVFRKIKMKFGYNSFQHSLYPSNS